MNQRRFKFALIIASTTGIAFLVGAVIFFNALPKPIRVEHTVEVDYGVRDPQFPQTLSALFGNGILGGNSIEVLIDGEAIYGAMLDAVASAEHTITFETYEFWGKESAGPMAQALADAGTRGVRVHANLDFVGSVQASAEKFDLMEGGGATLHRWREPSWYQLARFNHRTHRKLLIVDGRIGFIGGANIADNWLGGIENEAYRDNHFRIEGPIVAQLQGAFQENWLNAKGELLLGQYYLPLLEEVGSMDMQVVNSSPREGERRMRKLFLYAFAAAEERIRIASAYFYPDIMVLEALEDAARRGVDVEILVPGGEMDKGFFRHASVNRWQGILEAGVNMYEYEPRMLHAKLLIVDDHWTSLGSSNLDNRSFRINDETNVNVFGPEFAAQMNQVLDNDIKNARRYDLEKWKQRLWYKRVIGRMVMLGGAHF